MIEFVGFFTNSGVNLPHVFVAGTLLMLVLNVAKAQAWIAGKAIPVVAAIGAVVLSLVTVEYVGSGGILTRIGVHGVAAIGIWLVAVGAWTSAKMLTAKIGNGKET
jgi:hypothetical protein